MEYIDAMELDHIKLNQLIKEKRKIDNEITIENPHSMHNIAIGVDGDVKITIKGSTGFYTGGYMKGPSITIDGNAGWYVGDNMVDGTIEITKNTGSNAGAYQNGGTIIIRGGTGSRVGYGLKGGDLIVCGTAGRSAGQMTLGGRLILLGKVGKQVGESMYKGVIYFADKGVENNLGGNVFVDKISAEEVEYLAKLFEKHKITADASKLEAVRPAVSGRHTYVLFQPKLVVDNTHRSLKG